MDKWVREFNDDRSGSWVTKPAPLGSLAVGHNPWMSSDPKKPYTVTWWCGPFGDEVRVGYAASENAGKRMATDYMKRVSALFRSGSYS